VILKLWGCFNLPALLKLYLLREVDRTSKRIVKNFLKTVTWINAKNIFAKIKNAFSVPVLASAVV